MKKIKQLIFLLIVFASASIMNKNLITVSAAPIVTYKVHVQDRGWMPLAQDGGTAGTTGEGKRLEALYVNLSGIQYRVHITDVGWQSWKTSGSMAGTTSQSKAIQAVQIRLNGSYAPYYDVYYKLHVANYGWLGWTKNGATAGSTGLNLQAEAIQIKIVLKGTFLAAGGKAVLTKPLLTCRAHVSSNGWLSTVSEGKTAGTTGQEKALEAYTVNLKDFYGQNAIQYRAHVADIGWQNWVNGGTTAGTTGKSKAIEAVQIQLTSSLASYFDVYYRVHSQNYGWLGWTKNGQSAGTVGGGLRAEAIQIRLVNKGTSAPAGGNTSYLDLTSASGTSSNATAYFQNPMSNQYVCGNNWRSYYSSRAGRPYHVGLDVASRSGNTAIYAAASGTVARSGWNSANGNYVVIQHSLNGKTIYSFYAHLRSYSVSQGVNVQKGTQIGIMGNTGSGSAGAHLHFAIVDTLWSGSYYGYVPYFSGNKTSYAGVTYYNPAYVIQYNQLP